MMATLKPRSKAMCATRDPVLLEEVTQYAFNESLDQDVLDFFDGLRENPMVRRSLAGKVKADYDEVSSRAVLTRTRSLSPFDRSTNVWKTTSHSTASLPVPSKFYPPRGITRIRKHSSRYASSVQTSVLGLTLSIGQGYIEVRPVASAGVGQHQSASHVHRTIYRRSQGVAGAVATDNSN